MNKKLLITSLVLAAIVIVSVVAVLQRRGTGGTDQVRIAINLPLTGPIAAWSGQFANGFRMGVDDACKELGLDASQLLIDAQDNTANPTQAVSIFRKQQLDRPTAYITVTTGAANAIGPLLDNTGIPHFIAAFDPFIVANSPERLRVMANSKLEAPLFIQYAKSSSAKTVYIVHLDFSYAEEQMGKIVEPALKELGVRTFRERFALQDRDFKTIAEKVKVENPDLIFLVGYSFHLQALVGDLRTAGLAAPGRIMTSMDLVDLLHSDSPRQDLEGVVFACPHFDIPGKVKGADLWRERFTKRFGVRPTYVPAYAYDNAQLLVRALKQSGKVTVDSIKSVGVFEGPSGNIELDDQGDLVSTLSTATLDRDGRIIEIK